MAGLRFKVDTWRFWVGVAYLGIVLTIVGLYVVYVKANNEETKRVASARATAIEAVTTCFAAVKNAPVVDGFIQAHQALITNGIDSNTAALKIPNQPRALVKIRRQSLVRLNEAERNVDSLIKLVKESTPTTKSCVKLAVTTHVPYARFFPKN